MSMASELAALYRRDLTRLVQEIEAFPDDATLWRKVPGVTNSAGNLALHLEGNLREYIGRQLGNVVYARQREAEFAGTGLPARQLRERVKALVELVPGVIGRLTPDQLSARFPENLFGVSPTTQQVLVHLQGHLNYHLGQIDYLRRILTEGRAIEFANLQPE